MVSTFPRRNSFISVPSLTRVFQGRYSTMIFLCTFLKWAESRGCPSHCEADHSHITTATLIFDGFFSRGATLFVADRKPTSIPLKCGNHEPQNYYIQKNTFKYHTDVLLQTMMLHLNYRSSFIKKILNYKEVYIALYASELVFLQFSNPKLEHENDIYILSVKYSGWPFFF